MLDAVFKFNFSLKLQDKVRAYSVIALLPLVRYTKPYRLGRRWWLDGIYTKKGVGLL